MLEKFHSVAASVNVMSERNMKVVEQFSSVSKQTDFQKQTIIELTKSHKDITGTVGRYKNEVQMLEHKFKVVTQVMDDFKVQIKKDAAKAIATANASMALAEVLVHRFEQHVKESDETTERMATSLAEIEDEQLQQSEEIKRQNEEIQNLKQQQKKKQSFAKLGPHSFKYESSGLAVIDVGTHVELKSNKSLKLPPMPIAIIADGLEYNMTVSVVDHSLPEGCIVSLRSTAEEDKTLIIKGGQTTVVQLMVSFSSPLVIIPRVATPAFKLILEDVLTEHFHDASPRSRSNLQDPIELDVFIKGSFGTSSCRPTSRSPTPRRRRRRSSTSWPGVRPVTRSRIRCSSISCWLAPGARRVSYRSGPPTTMQATRRRRRRPRANRSSRSGRGPRPRAPSTLTCSRMHHRRLCAARRRHRGRRHFASPASSLRARPSPPLRAGATKAVLNASLLRAMLCTSTVIDLRTKAKSAGPCERAR